MVAIATPLPKTHGEYNMPRRACIDAFTPAELAIRQAKTEVENLGADLLLTQAVIKLAEAQNLVADWLEGKTG